MKNEAKHKDILDIIATGQGYLGETGTRGLALSGSFHWSKFGPRIIT